MSTLNRLPPRPNRPLPAPGYPRMIAAGFFAASTALGVGALAMACAPSTSSSHTVSPNPGHNGNPPPVSTIATPPPGPQPTQPPDPQPAGGMAAPFSAPSHEGG